MKGIKRIKRILILTCFVVATTSIPSFAATTPLPDVDINADNYASAAANISISDGKAKSSAAITGKIGITTKTSIKLSLQKYVNGKWTTIDSWSSTGETITRSLVKTKAVSKGYKYRTKAVCTAYAGSNKESTTKYSREVTY